jgi:hypothetical protein
MNERVIALDDALVARRIASGELVPLDSLGATPVDPAAVRALRERIDRRAQRHERANKERRR